MTRVIEIRTYTLKPGCQAAFLALFEQEVRPLLARWGVEVVAAGRSLADDCGAYLIRAFDSLEDRERREAAFYGSMDWRGGPRDRLLACIDIYLDAVCEVDEAAVAALRRIPVT